MRPQEVITDEYITEDPLGRGPKRSPPPQPQVRPAPQPPSRDFTFQMAVGGLQPMFPDAAFDKTASPSISQHVVPPIPQQQQQQRQRQQQQQSMNGGYQARQPYNSLPPPSHQGYDNRSIPPSPVQVYSTRQASPSSHSNHSHGPAGGSNSTYGVTGYSSPQRNTEREDRDPPPQTSSYYNDHSGSYQQRHQYQQPNYQHSDNQYSPHSNHKYNGERGQHQPPQYQQQYQRRDDYNQGVPMANSSASPHRREQYHSNESNVDYRDDRLGSNEYNRQSYASRPEHEYDRVPPPNRSQHPQSEHHYNYDHRGHSYDRLNRSEHQDRHYSQPRPQEYGQRYSPTRESYREATYEEQTSPLSIPSFVGGPPESNQEDTFVSPQFMSPQPSPFTSPQQYSSPHHHYPKETIDGGRRRSNGAKNYRHDNYYSPPPDSRDDYTGSSTIPTSSSPSYHRSPPPGHHHSHSNGHGEHYPENPMRPQSNRGCYSVDSIESTPPNRSHPPPTRPSYNTSIANKQSSSSLPNKTIPRYHQAEDNRRQSQARTQILKEIKQATNMRNSAMDDNDRKFWDRQIATLNASFRKL